MVRSTWGRWTESRRGAVPKKGGTEEQFPVLKMEEAAKALLECRPPPEAKRGKEQILPWSLQKEPARPTP